MLWEKDEKFRIFIHNHIFSSSPPPPAPLSPCPCREGPWILGGFCKVGVNLHFGRKSLIKVSQTHTQTHIHTYTHIDLQLWHVSFVWRSFTTDITIRVVFSKSFWNKKTNIFGNNWIIKKIIIYVTWVGSYLQKKLFYMIKTLF